MSNLCERCGKNASAMEVGWDYCANCGRTLCPSDMQRGCCGATPAVSGVTQDQVFLRQDAPAQPSHKVVIESVQIERDTPHGTN